MMGRRKSDFEFVRGFSLDQSSSLGKKSCPSIPLCRVHARRSTCKPMALFRSRCNFINFDKDLVRRTHRQTWRRVLKDDQAALFQECFESPSVGLSVQPMICPSVLLLICLLKCLRSEDTSLTPIGYFILIVVFHSSCHLASLLFPEVVFFVFTNVVALVSRAMGE